MAEPPLLTMIAGPNGSGKSTLTDQLIRRGIDLGNYINADIIDKSLSGPPGLARSRQAQKIAEAKREECLAQHRSFTFETVMSHESKIEFLERARAAGYGIVTYFVALEEPRLNVERVRQRVRLGGHSVPEDRIEKRYHRCLLLLPKAIKMSDRTILFDNSYRKLIGGKIELTPFLEIRRHNARLTYYTPQGFQPNAADIARMPRWIQPFLPAYLSAAPKAKTMSRKARNRPPHRVKFPSRS